MVMNMTFDFRFRAREALERARKELESSNFERLRYVALELRLAMEALTYDRAQAYAKEIPPKEYSTWQPRRILKMLLEIDSSADKGSTISIGEEELYGQPAKEMHMLGTETVFDLAKLKSHYDALGSFLHMPTLKQLEDGAGIDLKKLQARCERIMVDLEGVLASAVFNVTLGVFSSIECMECGKPVRKRVPAERNDVGAKCFECGAEYLLTKVGDDKIYWRPLQHEIKCAGPDCGHAFFLWHHEVHRGAQWKCEKCGAPYHIDFAVLPGEC